MNQTAQTRACRRSDSPASPGPAGPADVSRGVRDRLVRLAYRFLWNQADAEDAVQDAMATALAREADLRDRDKWWFWLCRILLTRCHQHGRQKLRRERHEAELANRCRGADRQAGDNDAEDTTELVRRMIPRLPRRQREVIVLRHLQQMSYGEIAEVLDVSPSTARVHARAGRETLRDLIQQERPVERSAGDVEGVR